MPNNGVDSPNSSRPVSSLCLCLNEKFDELKLLLAAISACSCLIPRVSRLGGLESTLGTIKSFNSVLRSDDFGSVNIVVLDCYDNDDNDDDDDDNDDNDDDDGDNDDDEAICYVISSQTKRIIKGTTMVSWYG